MTYQHATIRELRAKLDARARARAEIRCLVAAYTLTASLAIIALITFRLLI